MAPPSKSNQPRDRDDLDDKDVEHLEQEADVERGERLDSGKTIARGGKDSGHVPGADESTPDK
jgi:hypothetical protein